MKIRRDKNGYCMWLSARDTAAWATRDGNCWPLSVFAGRRLYVMAGKNGLEEITLNGREDMPQVDNKTSVDELQALVSDHLPTDLRKYWPVWEK
jgi:hypothetical protein